MVALKTCVLACASTEQFPIKAFLSRRFQSHLAISKINVFYSAQESMPFIIVHGTMKNVMRNRFNIKTATANWI